MSDTRINLIAKALTKAGRKTQNISLTVEFNDILREMTRLLPILRGSAEGVTTASQDYIPLPADYRSWRFLIIDPLGTLATSLDWIDPDPFQIYVKTNIITPTIPSKFTVVKEDSKIYLLATPDIVYNYYFAYDKIHPRTGKQLPFTSGGTYIPSVGETITGATSGATGVVSDIQVTSGKWISGDAAGKFTLSSQTGTFVSENLNIGGHSNIATISGNSTTEDNYVHYLDDEYEETIVAGLAYKACELIQDDRGLAYWVGIYRGSLAEKEGLNFRVQADAKATFWRQMGYGRN